MLKKDYFLQNTETVARNLIGCFLVCDSDDRKQSYQITETEAYLGLEDTASHARSGKTSRNKVMYKSAGTLYIYLIYGLHHMLNIVTGPEGEPEAVLIRGIEGADGPGKLTNLLGITKDEYNEKQLCKESDIWIQERPADFKSTRITAHPRVGIDYADDEWREKKLRFRLE
jgi:DNA-3-methyladenine glycosylase